MSVLKISNYNLTKLATFGTLTAMLAFTAGCQSLPAKNTSTKPTPTIQAQKCPIGFLDVLHRQTALHKQMRKVVSLAQSMAIGRQILPIKVMINCPIKSVPFSHKVKK